MTEIPFENFREWLSKATQDIGAHSAACLRMNNPDLRRMITENSDQTARWIESGMHGEMEYLERMAAEKADPWSQFPFAKSVIVLTFTNEWGCSTAGHPFPVPAADAIVGYVSAYAKEADYHTTGQKMLAELKIMLGEGIESEATVDTKAVEERLFALTGGLGVIGGNGLLRVPDRSNVRVFIGCLFVDVELPEVIHKPAMPFECVTCQACINNCPTQAIAYQNPMDARKCISYLTIEKRSVLSREEGAMIGDWIFGCDHCTTVCPPRDTTDLRIPVDLEWLLKTSAGELRRTLKGNAASYAGVTQLRKNAVIVLNNINSHAGNVLLDWTRKNTGSDLIHQQINLLCTN